MEYICTYIVTGVRLNGTLTYIYITIPRYVYPSSLRYLKFELPRSLRPSKVGNPAEFQVGSEVLNYVIASVDIHGWLRLLCLHEVRDTFRQIL